MHAKRIPQVLFQTCFRVPDIYLNLQFIWPRCSLGKGFYILFLTAIYLAVIKGYCTTKNAWGRREGMDSFLTLPLRPGAYSGMRRLI